jgi:thioredoxin reductase
MSLGRDRLQRVDVAVVGGGPSGLAAATELRAAGAGSVVVVEREREAGGIPRHAHHQGYGLRDLRRMLDGPSYARHWTQRATDAGATLRLETQVTGWSDFHRLDLTSPAGRTQLDARAVILATGCRERPRSARMVAGSRPQGVMTTGMLQQLVYLQGETPGRRAVVVGAEHVSFSALMTLHHGGARAVAMTTELGRHQSYAAFRLGAQARFRVRLRTRTRVLAIHGRPRVEAVEVQDLDTGAVQTIACDLVVFTGDWIPDHELAVLGGVTLHPGTRGPLVDAALRTSRPGVFAAGNLLHGAETADVAALDGRHVAAGVTAHLAGAPWPERQVPIVCAAPLQWIAPNAVTTTAGTPLGAMPPRGRYLLRATEELRGVHLELRQGERVLLRRRLLRVGPGRSAALPVDWAADVDPAGEPVVARVLRTRRRA